MPDLPPAHDKYEKDILNWVNAAVAEGDRFLAAQYGYDEIQKCINYVQGDQVDKSKPKDLSNFSTNRLGKVSTDIVAALTDIKPLFAYRTANKRFNDQAEILNKLSTFWWMNNFIDLKLGGAIQLAIPAGCAYLQVIYNQDLQGGHGDLDVVPLDARDVLPIRPSTSISVQDMYGVIIRSVETVNYLHSKYPWMRSRIKADHDAAFYQPRQTAFQRMMNTVMTPVAAALRPQVGAGGFRIPGKEVRTVYLKDDSINETDEIVRIGYGPEGERYSWSYEVIPGDMLYPRGRTIVCAKDIVFYDGPNVYWHGKFPLVKLYTDLSFVYPNSFLSKSILKDLIPHQDLLNEMVNGIADAVNQCLKRGIVADSRAIPRTLLEKLNSRKPGFKMMVNPSVGEGIKWQEPPVLPQYVFEFLQWLVTEIEYLSGSTDLSNLAKVKQIPAVESVEAIMQAMTPATRMRGRLMEIALREMAELVKFGFFQFYDAPRRIAVLGEDGVSLEDFDFDPGNLIPDETDMDYRGMPRTQRAIRHAHSFTFYVTPNSMLEVALVTKKMLMMRLRTMGEIDHQTFLESMEVPNIPQIDQRLQQEQMQQAQMAMMGATPQTGQIQGPGRRPTGQSPPHMESKDGGTRAAISES